MAAQIRASSESLLALINDILDLTKANLFDLPHSYTLCIPPPATPIHLLSSQNFEIPSSFHQFPFTF